MNFCLLSQIKPLNIPDAHNPDSVVTNSLRLFPVYQALFISDLEREGKLPSRITELLSGGLGFQT